MARGFRGGERRAAAVERLILRDGDRCWYCRCVFGTGSRRCTVDHVVPVARGGRNNLGDLRLACEYCNTRRARLRPGGYEQSGHLADRRRQMHREAMLASGAWLPRRAFAHSALRWTGGGGWTCHVCGQRGESGDHPVRTVVEGTARGVGAVVA